MFPNIMLRHGKIKKLFFDLDNLQKTHPIVQNLFHVELAIIELENKYDGISDNFNNFFL